MNKSGRLTTPSAALGVLLAAAALPAWSEQVALTGILGTKALVVVNGQAPRSLAAGESLGNVRVVSVGTDHAVVDVSGVRQTIELGATPVTIANEAYAQRLVLKADARGHFMNDGLINGKRVRYMIDTGATTVTLARADAERIGLPYANGQPVMINTVNGRAQGWRVRIESIRTGDVEVRNVDAVVVPESMPFVLLGNSFLNAFQMTRTNDEMVLLKK